MPPNVTLMSLHVLNVVWNLWVMLLGLAMLLIMVKLPIVVVTVLVVLLLALKYMIWVFLAVNSLVAV